MIFHFSLFTFHFAEGDGERAGERLIYDLTIYNLLFIYDLVI